MADYKRASILAIGTANPPNVVYQKDFPNEFFRLTGSEHEVDLKAKMQRLCEKNLTQKRYLGHMFNDIHKGKSNVLNDHFSTIDTRFRQDSAEISKIGAMAATKAIEEWGQPKTKITHLLVHSTSGIKMPGVDFEITKILELKPTVKRCMFYHYGCMSAGTTLRLAKDIVENNDGARVLIICSEVMMNFFHAPKTTNIQTSTLFGDGAGALIVGAKPDLSVERPIFEIIFNSQTIIPNTEGFITTELTGGGMVLNNSNLAAMGNAVSTSIEGVVIEAVKPLGIKDWNQLFWVAHPGAVKIMDGLQKKLNLKPEKLKESRYVLREYGNMASATVFFVMDEMRKNSAAQGLATTGEGMEYGVFLGIGPGMTLETIVLRSFPIGKPVPAKVA